MTLPAILSAPAALALALAAAGPVAAQVAPENQTTVGTITGTLGLDDAAWYVTPEAGEAGSFWERSAGLIRVRLVGAPAAEPSGAGGDAGTLSIEFAITGDPVERQAERVIVTYRPEPGATPLVAEGPNVDFELTALEVEGTDMALAGNIVAAMSPGGAARLALDADRVLTIDGNFQATIPERR